MIGALIGAGASLLGGLMNSRSADKQMKAQKQFAQNGIQWRAQDAEKAGISKLYALGANTTSYSPVSTGGGLGDAIGNAGQDIGRAYDANASQLQRSGSLTTDIARAQLDGIKIDNDIKRADLLAKVATRTQPGMGPGPNDITTVPHIPGQGNSTIKYEKRIAPTDVADSNRSYGVSPEVDMYRTKHGFTPEVPSELGEAQESQPLAAMQWFARNKIMPAFSDNYKTLPHKPPPGMRWSFNPIFGEYTLVKDRPSDWGGYNPNSWSKK